MCYYCLLIVANGGSISYSYTVPLIGVVNGVLNSLLGVRTLLSLIDDSNNSGFSYTYNGKSMGVTTVTCAEGTDVCYTHIGNNRRIG